MEQLHEMDINNISAPECAKVEVCIECEEREIEPVREKEIHTVPIKSKLSKLFRKSKYNAKYMEQVIPIQRLPRERLYRDYGIY
jgi:hypothetical protein